MREATKVGKMAWGYGSEFHLLRYLGYHRHDLNRAIEKETGGRVSDWMDFGLDDEKKLDREWKGVDFVNSVADVKSDWVKFWPQTGNVPNWDAIGLLDLNSRPEYLLVEAKAHVEEIQSSCLASKDGGLNTIREALEATIQANGFTTETKDWLGPYYQYANRLAHLHFLLQHNILARLVFIYFCGDNRGAKTLPNGKPPKCPKDAQEWDAYLNVMYDRLGLKGQTKLEERVHSLFLYV